MYIRRVVLVLVAGAVALAEPAVSQSVGQVKQMYLQTPLVS